MGCGASKPAAVAVDYGAKPDVAATKTQVATIQQPDSGSSPSAVASSPAVEISPQVAQPQHVENSDVGADVPSSVATVPENALRTSASVQTQLVDVRTMSTAGTAAVKLDGSSEAGMPSQASASPSPAPPSSTPAPPAPIKQPAVDPSSEPALQPVVGLAEEPATGRTAASDGDGQVQLPQVNKYTMLEVLGKGAFGKVRRCIDESTGEFRAVKILRKSILKRKRVGRMASALDNVQREIAVWKKLDHPHVVHLYDVIDDEGADKLYMVSELVDGGSVMPDEMSVEALDLPIARALACQLIDAISYLHFQNVAHRDIKPGNLLVSVRPDETAGQGGTGQASAVESARARAKQQALARAREGQPPDSDGEEVADAGAASPKGGAKFRERDGRPMDPGRLVLKVTDFGVSQVFDGQDDTSRSTAGTAPFLAPEMLTGGHFHGRSVDVYACGITLYMFLYGRPPFLADNVHELYEMIKQGDVPWPTVTATGKAIDLASIESARDLIMKLLDKNPETRITLAAAREHPFLRGGQGHQSMAPLPQATITVTEQEITSAISNVVKFRAMVKAAVIGKRKLGAARLRLKAAVAFAAGAAAAAANSTASRAASASREGGEASTGASRVHTDDATAGAPGATPLQHVDSMRSTLVQATGLADDRTASRANTVDETAPGKGNGSSASGQRRPGVPGAVSSGGSEGEEADHADSSRVATAATHASVGSATRSMAAVHGGSFRVLDGHGSFRPGSEGRGSEGEGGDRSVRTATEATVATMASSMGGGHADREHHMDHNLSSRSLASGFHNAETVQHDDEGLVDGELLMVVQSARLKPGQARYQITTGSSSLSPVGT